MITSKYVGCDEFGNRYFESRKVNRSFNRKARYVIYKGIAEASKVPSHWAIWLNFQTDAFPTNNNKLYKWETVHTPNYTGTNRAYFPSGHIKSRARRHKSTGDYTRWIDFEKND